MTKQDLLSYLVEVGEADAIDAAEALGVPYSTSAMALLRLVRQGLASRGIDPRRGTHAYRLTDQGQARLEFFETVDSTGPNSHNAMAPRITYSPPLKGATPMKRKKLHSGTYHCPTCFIEFELVAEENLKCDQCEGPLAEGSLDEVWDDEDQDVE
jgi:DNA-binding MarR family transcriptional regulator